MTAAQKPEYQCCPFCGISVSEDKSHGPRRRHDDPKVIEVRHPYGTDCPLDGFRFEPKDWNRRATLSDERIAGVLKTATSLETVEFWAAEFRKDPARLAGGMIMKLLDEYAAIRQALREAGGE